MKPVSYMAMVLCALLCLTGCGSGAAGKEVNESVQSKTEPFMRSTKITEFHVYPGLGYGFGLGTGTSAEVWLNDTVASWEKQMKK